MITTLEKIVIIVTELNKALDAMEKAKCQIQGLLINKPWSIPVECNRIKGHSATTHCDGYSEWSDE